MESDTQNRFFLYLSMGIALLFGCLSAATPDLIAHPGQGLAESLREGANNPTILSWLLVLLCGFALGFMKAQRPLLLGLAVSVPYIGLAMSEKAVNITAHPYFVLSFLYYCAMGLVAAAGIVLSQKLKLISIHR